MIEIKALSVIDVGQRTISIRKIDPAQLSGSSIAV
jgi:hypothetical protein